MNFITVRENSDQCMCQNSSDSLIRVLDFCFSVQLFSVLLHTFLWGEGCVSLQVCITQLLIFLDIFIYSLSFQLNVSNNSCRHFDLELFMSYFNCPLEYLFFSNMMLRCCWYKWHMLTDFLYTYLPFQRAVMFAQKSDARLS